MTGVELNDIAPYPRTRQEATADTLARSLAVCAQANMVRALDGADAQTRQNGNALFVNLFGVVKLLRALRNTAPETADEVAGDLWEDWEAGHTAGQELHEWLLRYEIDPDHVRGAAVAILAREGK